MGIYVLSEEQLAANKEEFISLLRSISREGADIEGLLEELEKSDFYYAPASTKYHGAYVGGLVDHSLNVFYNMMHLVKYKKNLPAECYDEDSIKIIALLHDLAKMNQYERTFQNKKVYCSREESKLFDDNGNFKWVSEPGFKTREDHLVYGSHEMNSELRARKYIPLTMQESSAILHHMGGMAWDSAKDNISEVYAKYPLALFVFMADCMATYVDEQTF